MKTNHVEFPSFERYPFRAAELASYRTNVPPRHKGSPCYEAIPAPRTPQEVCALFEINLPTYDPAVRALPAVERRERAYDVLDIIFPMERQVTMEHHVLSAIRNSYAGRNIATHRFMEQNVALASAFTGNGNFSGGGQVGTGCIIGPPGTGKSETIKRILFRGCPQVILHESYNGQPLGVQQLAWLYLSCPPKSSVSALIETIAALLDYIFKTDVLKRVVGAKNDSLRGMIVSRALALHVTGIVVIDEIQNIRVGTKTERKTFENFLQELVNTTRTKFLFVGTPEFLPVFTSKAMRRRLSGDDGIQYWMPFRHGEEWKTYLAQLWKWQVTATETPLTSELSETMYELTFGVPGYAASLWAKAQSLVIEHPDYPNEIIKPRLLTDVMTTFFPDEYAAARQLRGPDIGVSTKPKPRKQPVEAPPESVEAPPDGNASLGYDTSPLLS